MCVAGAVSHYRDYGGSQYGVNRRQLPLGGFAHARQRKGGITVQGICREGDDLEQIGTQRHQAFSGL
ncbi:MAG: hypothetical protein WBS14_22645 [Rhodomicrobium sp.]